MRGVVVAVSQQVGVAPNVTGGLLADHWLLEEGGRQYLREFVAFCRRGSFWMGWYHTPNKALQQTGAACSLSRTHRSPSGPGCLAF